VKPEHAVTVNRKISAPLDAVYAAYTKPDRMRGWMGEVEADVRVGGRYRIRVQGDDGSTYVHQGVYELLEPPRRIVMMLQAGPEGAKPPASPAQTEEFIELRFIPLGPAETEVWLLNGWHGDDLDDAGAKATEAAWLLWLERLDAFLRV
jgi:uncharacterized protein YndB with AHSA1/START domain